MDMVKNLINVHNSEAKNKIMFTMGSSNNK